MLDTCHPTRALVLAARVDDLAAELTSRAHRLAAATGAGEWDGPAARAFRHRAHETISVLRHAAILLEQSADAVRRQGVAAQAESQRRELEHRLRQRQTERILHRLGVP